MSKKAKDNKKSIVRRRTRLLKQEDEEKMKEMGLEAILENISQINTREGIGIISAMLLNALMKKERELYLKTSVENKANGYYDRKLACLFGNLDLAVPRDRKGEFRPAILPSEWQKTDESFEDFINNLVLQSYSPNKIRALLSSMNLPYSVEQIEEIKEDLYLKAKEMKTKELPQDVFALFIDAYHTSIKDEDTNRVKKAVIYNAIGIDMEGKKGLYGYYVFFGSESKEDWLQILNDLINRGLKRVMLIVSDDFSGLVSAIKALFPNTDHQLCFIHMQRNIKRNMSKDDAKVFYDELESIKLIKDYDKAIIKFEDLCKRFERKYPLFMKLLQSKKELYFTYLKYPEQVRKHVYTTNIVENFNSRLEVTRVNNGGYFQSLKTTEVAIYVTINRIQTSKWKKPLPAVRAALYELKQMFNAKFSS
jgi:transposase-like protein